MPESFIPLFIDPTDERWINLISTNPHANIFHHPAWSELMAKSYGYRPFIFGVGDGEGNLGAALPMMEVKSPLRGRRWVSLPFSDHCAPLYRERDYLDSLIEAVVAGYQGGEISQLELRWPFDGRSDFQNHSEFVLHTAELEADFEAMTRRIHSMHRRNTRVAQKNDVQIVWGNSREHLDEFYQLHLQTRRRQGVPIQPTKFFDWLSSLLIEKGLGFVLLAYKDDACLAAAVFLHWGKTLTYKYGASSTEGLNLRPNNLIFWEAIRWGCENGYTAFDMGRTDLDNPGLQKFKARWGAEEIRLSYSALPNTPAQSKNDQLMPVMQTVIRNSPLWVCKASGEFLYRYFAP